MTVPFQPSRNYLAELDARREHWKDVAAAVADDLPIGVVWTLVGPRRCGKTWALKALQRHLAADHKIEAVYVDLTGQPQKLEGLTVKNAGFILVDEPEQLVRSSPAQLLTIAAGLKDEGRKLMIAMTPAEWSLLRAADPAGQWLRDLDRRPIAPLEEAQWLRLARTPWAPALVSELPAGWRQSPFLLEMLLWVADKAVNLRDPAQMDRLLLTVLEELAGINIKYFEAVFQRGLSEPQREVLRALQRETKPAREAAELLDYCGLIDLDRRVVRDPVLIENLPRPLVIHHISDVHFGSKLAPVADNKLPGPNGDAFVAATAAANAAESYADRIRDACDKDQGPHIIIVSGDIAETGNASEFAQAAAWLAKLRDSVRKQPHPQLDWNAERVLLTGGNHDVDWSCTDRSPGARHATFQQHFADYPHPHLERAPELRELQVVSYPQSGLDIALLGSSEYGGQRDPELSALLEKLRAAAHAAFTTDDHAAYERLRREVDRIDPSLVHQSDLSRLRTHPWKHPIRIAVLHHPVSPIPSALQVARFSALINAGAVKDACLFAGIQIVLHGHEHSGWIGRESWPGLHGERVLHVVSAPSLGSREVGERRGYNEIRLVREGENRHIVEIRQFVQQGADWRVSEVALVRFDVDG